VASQQVSDFRQRQAQAIERLFEQLRQRLEAVGGWHWREKCHAEHAVIDIRLYPAPVKAHAGQLHMD
jgi:hypothetical protein